ncbi:hypothetical protein [Cellulomonas fulva]|uniref:hypothetical protein n=1 Tax=Cellulomonas fulva TaxID=2835530 RepID=UPI0027DB6C81|nr:hypothetical protein [Cellulomonas fulva]
MHDEIEIVSDGNGIALLGDAGAIGRFLASEGLPSTDLGLHRLRAATSAGASALEAGSQIAGNSGRWVQLTEKSARAMKTMPLMKGSAAGSSRAVAMDGGKTGHILEIVRTPGAMLTNPAMLTGVAGLMAQVAMQQAMQEITDYLARIDAKVDDVLRAQKDAALSAMVGAQLVIEDALTIREQVGSVSDVTWSKVQATPATIAQTQAYALRQLDSVAQKLERASAVGDVAKAAQDAQSVVDEWLAVLARCFQLQDAVAVLELDRVLGAAPEEIEQHRAGILIARQKRLDTIARSTERLMMRMDAAAATANAKVLLHPRAAQTIKVSSGIVESSVVAFNDTLGVEAERESVAVRRWLDAATDARDRALESGATGIESAKGIGEQTLGRAKSATTRLTGAVTARATRKRPEITTGGEDD